jgi:teichoic acid transport system ATP-binding protein
MKEMMSRAKIIVVVSHDLGTLPRLCETGVWLAQGRVQMVGPIDDVIAAYREHTNGLPAPTARQDPDAAPPVRTGFAQPTYV